MGPITSCCSNSPTCRYAGTVSGNFTSARYSRIKADSNQSKDITLFTEEGDKVTLSFQQETSLMYTGLNGLTYKSYESRTKNQTVLSNAMARLKTEMIGFDVSRDLTLTVEGDLNEEERKDIAAAVIGIDHIMTDLLASGKITSGISDARDLRELDTIAKIQADYQYETTISIAQTRVQESSFRINPRMFGNRAFSGHRRNGNSFIRHMKI